MITMIRKVKDGTSNTVILKASSAPLPRHESWKKVLEHHWDRRERSGATSIPHIMARDANNISSAITCKGQKGDGRDLRPTSFEISCPKCKALKEVAKCTLYTTQAKVLACGECSSSFSSSRWQCRHEVLWMHCTVCRELGFRCAGQAKRSLKRVHERSEAVERRTFKRYRRLGPLGSSTASNSIHQSIRHIKKSEKLVKKQKQWE